ncbi:MAG: OmpP1/FadL family transporter [Polyangiales bacterium]
MARATRAALVVSALVVAGVTLTMSRRVLAGPTETYGFFSRSTALGGAVSADATDSSANFYNPAGLAGASGLSFDVGYVRADPHLAINGRDTDVDPVHGLVFGLVAPGRIGTIPFAFGVGLHLPDDRVFRVRSLDQLQPRWELYDNTPQRIYLSANVAVEPFPGFQIGGGLTFLASTSASLSITGGLDIADVSSSRMRHEVDASLQSVRYPEAGVRITPHKRLRLAGVYRGEFQLDLNIDARVMLDAQALGLTVPFLALIHTASVNAFLPRNVVVGASWDASDDVTVDADLTWVQWSAYKSPVTAVDATTKLDAPPGFPASLVPTSPAPTIVEAPRFADRIVPRVGVEWRLPLGPRAHGHRLALRAGYFYERSPVPAQSGGTNFVDADRHAFSAGLGVVLHALGAISPGDLRLDVHAQWSVLPERTFEKSSAADLVGDYSASGTIVSVGTTLGVTF